MEPVPKAKAAGAKDKDRRLSKVQDVVAQQAAIREREANENKKRLLLKQKADEAPDKDQTDHFGAYLDADKEAQRQREAAEAFTVKKRTEAKGKRAAQKRLKEHRQREKLKKKSTDA